MELSTNLQGRLRNINLPRANALLPLLETVVNSIQAIDERGISMEDAYVHVELLRSKQLKLDKEDKSELIGFRITDNGIGFNENNFSSFQTLDTDYKIEQGCRGIGRLLWIKMYDDVRVVSSFENGYERSKRKLSFSGKNGIADHDVVNSLPTQEIKTTITLNKIKEYYRGDIPQANENIARQLLEHCLWYFIRDGGPPTIKIIDGDEAVDLDTVYDEYMLSSSKGNSLTMKGENFSITHIKLKSSTKNKHAISYCAGNRVVKTESLSSKIPGLFGILNDGKDDFYYLGFITSNFLDEQVKQERTEFNLPEKSSPLLADSDISLEDIRELAISNIKAYLEKFIQENKKQAIARVEEFVATKAPRYRPVLARMADDDKCIDPDKAEADLELELHKHLFKTEQALLREGQNLTRVKNVQYDDKYKQKLQSYLAKASDIKQSDLAAYISRRKVIIDLLEGAIAMQDDGKYSKEKIIHDLIMPMRYDSDSMPVDSSNLWLLDERLAFHHYLSSDIPLNGMPIISSTESKKPDLLALSIYDNPILVNPSESPPLASITVVEIKRPMTSAAVSDEWVDPLEQAIVYLQKIRKGKVTTASGRRPIPNSEHIPGFCYVLCDFDNKLIDKCEMMNLHVTSDKMGYFGFIAARNTYVEVISYNRLVNSAKERNQAFFEKLGISSV